LNRITLRAFRDADLARSSNRPAACDANVRVDGFDSRGLRVFPGWYGGC